VGLPVDALVGQQRVKLQIRRLLCFSLLLTAAAAAQEQDLTQWVDPLIGTRTSYELSRGNTYPAAARPGGMTSWAPQTAGYENALFYTYDADSLNGIRATHQASVWMSDYGDFSLMAVTGEPGFLPAQRASPFLHDREWSRPESYAVDLPRYALRLEVAPTSRAAVVRVRSTRRDTVTVIFDPHPPGTLIEILPSEARLRALTATHMGGTPDNFRSYLTAQFDRIPVAWGTWTDSTVQRGATHSQGDHSGAWVRFADVRTRPLTLRVGTSFLGAGQAEINVEREIGAAGLNDIAAQGRRDWNALLGRARVEDGSEERNTVFYTALYRSLLFPRDWHEIDAEGRMIHFSPYDGQVHEGPMVADFGLWDAYRTHLPLHFFLFPERGNTILQGLVNAYREGGWFPKWAGPGYRDGMPGTHAEIIIADAWAKQVRGFDVESAYEGLRRNAVDPGDKSRGRIGLVEYDRLGYVPADLVDGSVSRTLEFAYGDFCVSLMARALGHEADATRFSHRAQNWRHVFDETSGFVRGRNADGSWAALDPVEWGGPFVEGNAWHYTWGVPHNIPGLVEVLGGKSAMAARLDSFLNAPPTVHTGEYGRMIHEMKEMVASGMGQYAHGNQPSHHVPYLYNHTDAAWKTAPLARDIGDRLYRDAPDGYAGDEDTGSLGSWYVFTALGLYPIAPGVPTYALGAPRFARAELRFGNGNRLIVEGVGIDVPGAVYVQAVSFDGERLHMPFVEHDRLMQGGTLRFVMGTEPNADVYSSVP
jgi:predicted alpha-1,2-mannosidase